MTADEFQSYAIQKGYRVQGTTAFGIYNNYPFTMRFRKGNRSVVVVQFVTGDKISNSVFKNIKRQIPKKEGALLRTPNRNDSVQLQCSGKDDVLFQNLEESMSAVTMGLASEMLRESQVCPICGHDGCDAYGYAKGAYTSVHRSCIENQSSQVLAAANKNLEGGSYAAGLIGALLGALVGAIPSFLSIMFANLISAWLCCLIPLGSYFGYKLLKGKMTNVAIIFIILASLLQVFILEQSIWYATIVKELGLWPSVFDSVAYYFELYTVGDMVAEMGQILLFIALGIFITFGQISRTAHAQVTEALSTMDTVIDK